MAMFSKCQENVQNLLNYIHIKIPKFYKFLYRPALYCMNQSFLHFQIIILQSICKKR
jgi:hypothetical protein